MKYFDNTRIETFRNCPRKFYFRHVRHWKPVRPAPALAFGLGWHTGMDELWMSYSVDGATVAWEESMIESGIDFNEPSYALEEKRNKGTAKEMFTNYLKQNERFMKSVELIAVEQPFAVPLTTDEDTYYIGRLDKVIRLDGKINGIEHKTTSSYKKDGPFTKNFLRSFSPNSQIDGYLYSGNLVYGEEFRGIWIDAALVHKTVHNGFRYIPIQKQFEMLDAWLSDTLYWTVRIRGELGQQTILPKDRHYMPTFPKNTSQCSVYSGCEYQDLCRMWPNPEHHECPDGFVEEKWEPFDTLKLDKIGMEKGE